MKLFLPLISSIFGRNNSGKGEAIMALPLENLKGRSS
jgi:hypothetical protein